MLIVFTFHFVFYNISRRAQVAGALVIFEVQRSSRSEARKEEQRRQELEVFIDIVILVPFEGT